MGNIPTAFHIAAPRKHATRKRSPEDICLVSTILLVSTRLRSDSIAAVDPIAAGAGVRKKRAHWQWLACGLDVRTKKYKTRTARSFCCRL